MCLAAASGSQGVLHSGPGLVALVASDKQAGKTKSKKRKNPKKLSGNVAKKKKVMRINNKKPTKPWKKGSASVCPDLAVRSSFNVVLSL
jgi:hypothetical protein